MLIEKIFSMKYRTADSQPTCEVYNQIVTIKLFVPHQLRIQRPGKSPDKKRHGMHAYVGVLKLSFFIECVV